MAYNAVASLVQEVTPFVGQDCRLRYRVYASKAMSSDATITSWVLVWSLFSAVGDSVALLTKTTASGITLATPYATVALSAANLTLTAGEYGMQLWRNESGDLYPLTGVGRFILRAKPPLTT